ncbi:MAG: hypothetical protein ACRESJ_33750, partial [Pseudomonas sp.]|uniref:hypothetical protein n=1 Tax=Pseudomonas sp. TaxID=306 RepID=UPI003D6E2B80
MSLLAALLFALTPEAPYLAPYLTAAAEVEGANPRYVDCIKLIEEDVEIGRIAAQQWALEGGGPAAQHCLAIADIAAGFPRLGAVRLMTLSDRPQAGDATARARIKAEAALAFLDAGASDFAEEALIGAL